LLATILTKLFSQISALVYKWVSRFYYDAMEMKRDPEEKLQLNLFSKSTEKAIDYKPAPIDFAETLRDTKEDEERGAPAENMNTK